MKIWQQIVRPDPVWTEASTSPGVLAARAVSILICRRANASIYAQRGCEELDLRYLALKRALESAHFDPWADPAELYPRLLERVTEDDRLRMKLVAAIGINFKSNFGKLAAFVQSHWEELPEAQRALAAEGERWVDEEARCWSKPIPDELHEEMVHTARLLYLFTNIWLLRRYARLLAPDQLSAARDFPGMAFPAVLDEEMEEIEKRRGAQSTTASAGVPLERAAQADLAGLAFSGGGIRSATFNLGVLQYLGQRGMLRSLDYLSTVSGGGYIGAWLHAWIRHDGARKAEHDERPRPGIESVELGLEQSVAGDPQDDSASPIQFLRSYSNYLTPKAGSFSADTWTMVNIWLRNIFLNLMVLVLALSAVLLTPYWLGGGLHRLPEWVIYSWPILVAVTAVLIGLNTRKLDATADMDGIAKAPLSQWASSENGVLALGVLPTFAGSVLGGIQTINAAGNRFPLFVSVAEFGLLVAVFALVTCAAGRLDLGFYRDRLTGARGLFRTIGAYFWIGGTSLLSGVVAGTLYYYVTATLQKASSKIPPGLQVLTWSAPVFVALLSLSMYLVVGFLGRRLPDYRREWVARLAGWLGIVSIAWLGLCALATYSGLVVALVHDGTRAALGSTAWIATSVGGVFSSRSIARSQQAGGKSPSMVATILAKLAPPVFVLGLLVMLSYTLEKLNFHQRHPWEALAASMACGAAAMFLSSRIDINEFSLHQFYRNRLVRCYLGAARQADRKPNPFTGFDPLDDFRLMELAPSRGYTGPYSIVNATLNVVHGDELAWQERKGEAFMFTPQFCGFNVDNSRATHPRTDGDERLSYGGYRPTQDYAYPDTDRKGGATGVHVGRAMAISGAAVSPNMGSMTSSSLAFLLTVLGARLGWWLGNPRRSDSWQTPGPRTGLFYLLAELTANTNDMRSHVYLSDGGHFENMAMYELVRRRCRYIVVCDAEQDAFYTFSGIGNAIRKCRTDFGVEIRLDLSEVKPKPGQRSASHCAIAEILYPPKEGVPACTGTLLYIKSSLTGDEPVDLFQYWLTTPVFPQESTADQWFDETKFESYRALGYHAAASAFEALEKAGPANAADGPFAKAVWGKKAAAIAAASA